MMATTRRTRTPKQTIPPDEQPVEALAAAAGIQLVPTSRLAPGMLADLRRPFTAAAVKFKPQSVSKTSDRALASFYIDARLAAERLNHVVGADNWSPAFRPVMAETNAQAWMACFFPVECTLTVLGVPKADVGVYTNGSKPDEKAVKSAYSDALKRAAVQFGVGAYLYALPKQWFPFNRQEKRWLNEAAIRKAYEKMIEPFGQPIDHGDLSDPELEDHDEPEPAGKPVPAPEPVAMASKHDFDGMCMLAKNVGIPREDLATICKTEKDAHGGYRQVWLDEQLDYLNKRSESQASA
jgi:hypothetical protein